MLKTKLECISKLFLFKLFWDLDLTQGKKKIELTNALVNRMTFVCFFLSLLYASSETKGLCLC